MLRNKKTRPGVEQVAMAVEGMATHAVHPTLRSFQAAAAALSPAVFPTERYRADTKAMMLREFTRPRTDARADAGSQDGLDVASDSVVTMECSNTSLTLADIEPVDAARAQEAADAIEAILDRHDRRAHLR